MSDVDSILEQIAELSFSEMLQLNASLAILLKKEGKGGVVGRALKKEKKKDADAPKRQAATGTLAWIAFVKKIKEDHPDLFTECTKEPERLAVVKEYRAENMEEYKEFVKTFKEDAGEAASEEEDEAPAPVKKPAPAAKKPAAAPSSPKTTPVANKEDKLAAVRALAEKKKAAAASSKATAEKKAEAPAKKPVKTAAKKEEPAEEEDDSMGKIEIDGTHYHIDKKTNGLYAMEEGESFGPWVGYYQPETEDIRHTDAPEEE